MSNADKKSKVILFIIYSALVMTQSHSCKNARIKDEASMLKVIGNLFTPEIDITK